MGEGTIAAFEAGRFNAFEAYVSVPIFEAPDNYSSYHDSEIDQQIVVTLPNSDIDE